MDQQTYIDPKPCRIIVLHSVMVSVGVSKFGCTELLFVEPGVKINGAY